MSDETALSKNAAARGRAARRRRALVTGCVATMLFALVARGGLAGAAPALPAIQELDLDDFPRNDLDDLPEQHRLWIEAEVRWIITERERDVFLRLDTDEKRDTFIEEFWRQRDPTPGTSQNEYRDLHYERFEHAARFFGRDTPRPGWRTDMGKVWILLGEPRDTNRLPNTSMAQPVEVWFYGVDPKIGVPPFFYVVFFKDRGVGEYRLYSPLIDGPEKLLNPAGVAEARRIQTVSPDAVGIGSMPTTGFGEMGAFIDVLQTVDAQLAQAAISLIPGGGAAQMGMSPLRSEMMLTQIWDLPNRIMPEAAWAFNVLAGFTESEVRFETLPLESQAVALLDPSGIPFVHVATRTVGERLNLNSYEGSFYVTFEISTTIMDDELRTITDADPRVMEAELDEERARQLRTGKVTYMERLPAIPGDYRLSLMVENNVSREFGRAEFELDIPVLGTGSLTSSPPILASTAQALANEYDPYGDHYPFQIGDVVMLPSFDGPFAAGGTAAVFHQLVVPADMIEPILATYSLYDADDQPVLEHISRIDLADKNELGILNKLTHLQLTDVEPGEYRLEVDIEMDDRGPASLPVVVAAPDEVVEPFVHAQRHAPPTDPEVALTRARQLRTVGRTDDAIDILDDALARAPGLEGGVELQIELLTDAGRYEDLKRLLEPRLVREPNDVELLVTLADVNARLGEHYDAIRFYERARMAGGDDSPELLNPLAAEYYAEGNLSKARELIEESLRLDPEQPEIRRLLQEVVSRSAVER